MATHYLKKELYDLISSQPEIFDFLQSGSLDGLHAALVSQLETFLNIRLQTPGAVLG